MKKSLILGGGILMLALGLILYGKYRIPEPIFHGKLVDLLPSAPSGWVMKSKEIANTPEMKQAVGELLNYDDGVLVDYTNGSDRISVYIAYWRPGKMSYRLIAAHTPDVCWVGNGWVKEESEVVSGIKLENGRTLPPAAGRLFTISNNREYVWFWHIVGSEVKSYGTGYAPPWYGLILDLLDKGFKQREEQFFIRLSSNIPLETPSLRPVLQAILINLPLPKNSIPNS